MELGAYIAPSAGFLDTYLGANFNSYNLVISAKEDENGKSVAAITQERLIAILELCQQKGVDVVIQLHHALVRSGYNVFTQAYPDVDFTDYSVVKGFFICDEPTWGQLEVMDTIYVPWFNTYFGDTDMEFYVNLFGGYSSAIGPVRDANGNVLVKPNGDKYYNDATQEQKDVCYAAYVAKWLKAFEKVKSSTKFFTIDCYPFSDNQVGKVIIADVVNSSAAGTLTVEQLYQDLLQNSYLTEEYLLKELPEGYERYLNSWWLHENYLAANNAKNNSLSYGAFIQAFDEGGPTDGNSGRTYRLPTTLAEIKWQAYIQIAFGAKKLVYYGYDNTMNGTYMTQGSKPTSLYHLVKETNEELLKVDHVFMAFKTWVGVKTFLGKNSTKNDAFDKIKDMELKSLTGVSSVVSSRDLLVGEMVDEGGNHGYMLVGYDDPFYGNQTEVSMTFGGARGLIVYRNGQRSLSELVNGQFTVTLNAGEGVFVIPVY